ncbi:putative thiazole-containing bacteriocin maturation protein [Brevibacillus choshinensis]|uniref:Thiazole-containing bacteriocin maturation protein n=1 Tax=Brevibacillus choshinensis TaxID=54911 RepID=A0ABX7FNE3_BRECH|nr:putative thiazole-containing bacteriocin maturation protein [Brevibacillus choshinensis]QRG67194.1 putative thiazole-containing bacteriocin maturation protein [Brevibacillus choshinensis]
MENLDSSMRLKVKRDAFFLPDPKGSVYFRNNVGSFRMEGAMIDRWVEQLLPMFNGEHTLEELTDGLPDEYRDQVFEIARSLYQNGFVQDVSQEIPHQLPEKILAQYGTQIEFLSHLAGSGAHRFMGYRQSNIVAVGSGPFFVSMIGALLESGLPKFHMLITDEVPTNRQRIEELAAHARKKDPDVAIEELAQPQKGEAFWREAFGAFEAVLYVSQTGNIDECRQLRSVCKEAGKSFLPAILMGQVGLAGPLEGPDSAGCWESAWRRIHQQSLGEDLGNQPYCATAGAMLANVIVFEWFKAVTGVTDPASENQVYLLKTETMEGNWHSYEPHPAVMGSSQVNWTDDLEPYLNPKEKRQAGSGLLSYFSTLSSPATGIFHRWEEEDLIQLPLSQCFIQIADPLSDGPAQLLPQMVCTGLTHEEARKEAGLTGIEAYVSRLTGVVGVGAGESAAEGICRALQSCLSKVLERQLQDHTPSITTVAWSQVEDQRCQYYLQVLSATQGEPRVGLGASVHGFPVVWVGIEQDWYGSVGLHVTLALRKSLETALLHVQNQNELRTGPALKVTSVQVLENGKDLVIPLLEEEDDEKLLASCLEILGQNGKHMDLCDLAHESFLREELAGVFGVRLREEESQ